MARQQLLNTPARIRSRVILRKTWPRPEDLGPDAVVLYDRRLLELVPELRRWLKSFSVTLGLQAGEKLKNAHTFGTTVSEILRVIGRSPSGRARAVVAIGGGSVGDFAGFFASVYHRGVPLIQIPSTWLAALDSAHGGKTALNVGEAKNQLGTFHPAEKIYLLESLLKRQPQVRVDEAMGELVKMALIDGGAWVKRFESSRLRGANLVWKFLPDAVLAKYKVVDRDPLERSGHRAVLNLGHTLGHVLELHAGLAHGLAVACGLHFAVGWSRDLGLLAPSEESAVRKLLQARLSLDQIGLRRRPRAVPRAQFLKLAMRDKKKASGRSVKFIFLGALGRPAAREVSIEEFYSAAKAAGWAR